MLFRHQRSLVLRLCLYALPLAIYLIFLFPLPGKAHAVLLWSDPAKDELSVGSPSEVRLQFSEGLNPTFSTAAVVNAANQRVDRNDAHLLSDDPREMDISLKPSLPSDVYVVVWQTQSADDGHVLRGSFLFKVVADNGTIPSLKGTYPGQNVLGGDNATSGLYTGQMDGPTLFSFVMVTLVNLSVIFWVGAQLWHTFVSQPPAGNSAEQHALDQNADQRFELFFSIPTLLVALIANLGALIGQGLWLTGGNFLQLLPLFGKLISNDRFARFRTIHEVVLLLALALAIYTFRSRQRPRMIDEGIRWTNLTLGLALLTTMTLSGYTAVTNTSLIYAVVAGWLHLLVASLWIGGIMYLSMVYLPTLKGKSLVERTRALLTIVSSFLPLAIASVVIMALTGPFNASVHVSTLNQMMTTTYGHALIVKVVCVGALLVTSAIHVWFFRSRLNKTLHAYQSAIAKAAPESEETESTEKREHSTSREVRHLERNVARQTRQLIRGLRWELVLGIAVLICTGLMTVFAGTLQPVTADPSQLPPTLHGKVFNKTVLTTDGQFRLKLTITPNSFGTNVFLVQVLDSNGKQDTNVSVSLSLAMVDMYMGTNTLNLQPDGKGGFGAPAILSMVGNWQVQVIVRTPDNTLHEATVAFFTPPS